MPAIAEKKKRAYPARCGCGAQKIDGRCPGIAGSPGCIPRPHRRISEEERAGAERERRARRDSEAVQSARSGRSPI